MRHWEFTGKMGSLTLVLVAAFVAIAAALPTEKYTTKFDNINVKDILASDRLIMNYVECLKGSGKCTPDGSELKRNLPDALETGCAKCSDAQRKGSREVIIYLINQKPELWKELEHLYDKEGKYKVKYQKEYDEYIKGQKV